jgi:hypothetical protein
MATSKGPLLLGAAAVGALVFIAKGGLGGGRGGSPRTTTFDLSKEVDLTSLLGESHLLSIPGDKLVLKGADPKTVVYEANETEDVAGWLKVTPQGFGGGEIVIERVVPVTVSTEERISGPLAQLKPGEDLDVDIAAIDMRLLPSDTVYQVRVRVPRKG